MPVLGEGLQWSCEVTTHCHVLCHEVDDECYTLENKVFGMKYAPMYLTPDLPRALYRKCPIHSTKNLIFIMIMYI